MFRFTQDPSGVLEVEASGFWTVVEADQYMSELTARLTATRARYGYALVLVDGRQAQVQTAEVMKRMSHIQQVLISNDRDRAAYIVTSSLAKMQAQRLSTSERLKVFLSPTAARIWLLAYENAAATDPHAPPAVGGQSSSA